MTVNGYYFTPGQTETITFIDKNGSATAEGTRQVLSNGTFSNSFGVPTLAATGMATVKVTGTNGTFTASFKVIGLLGTC